MKGTVSKCRDLTAVSHCKPDLSFFLLGKKLLDSMERVMEEKGVEVELALRSSIHKRAQKEHLQVQENPLLCKA